MNWNRLRLIGEALKSVTNRTYHFDAAGIEAPYIVWGEDGTGSQEFADNRLVSRTLTGTVDYFTKNTEDPNLQKIEDAMEAAGALFRLESVQFEENTGVCHYEWTWEFG